MNLSPMKLSDERKALLGAITICGAHETWDRDRQKVRWYLGDREITDEVHWFSVQQLLQRDASTGYMTLCLTEEGVAALGV